jgi:hypothetical protein
MTAIWDDGNLRITVNGKDWLIDGLTPEGVQKMGIHIETLGQKLVFDEYKMKKRLLREQAVNAAREIDVHFLEYYNLLFCLPEHTEPKVVDISRGVIDIRPFLFSEIHMESYMVGAGHPHSAWFEGRKLITARGGKRRVIHVIIDGMLACEQQADSYEWYTEEKFGKRPFCKKCAKKAYKIM